MKIRLADLTAQSKVTQETESYPFPIRWGGTFFFFFNDWQRGEGPLLIVGLINLSIQRGNDHNGAMLFLVRCGSHLWRRIPDYAECFWRCPGRVWQSEIQLLLCTRHFSHPFVQWNILPCSIVVCVGPVGMLRHVYAMFLLVLAS